MLLENEKRKFHLTYRGPYKIIEVSAPNYVITTENRSFVKRVHFNCLKPSFGDYTRKNLTQLAVRDNDHIPPVGFYVSGNTRQTQGTASGSNPSLNNRPHAAGIARPQRSRRPPAYYSEVDQEVHNATH